MRLILQGYGNKLLAPARRKTGTLVIKMNSKKKLTPCTGHVMTNAPLMAKTKGIKIKSP